MNPTATLLEPEVRELILEGRFGELQGILHDLPFADVADIFAELEPDQAALGFRCMKRDDAGEVFAYLTPEKQEELIQKLGAEGAVRMVEAMSPDDRAALLDELPTEVAQRLIASLSPAERKATQAILGYPPKSVGRLMTPDYVSVRPAWTISQALDHVRKVGRDAETINVVYVVDDKGALIDDLRLRQVLLGDPGATVESIMNRQFVALRADEPQEEAVRMMARYDRIALPVVDSRGALLGIVTSDDVADVAQAEATEDFQKMGGVAVLEEPYMRAGRVEMFKKRGMWLSILFAGQSVTILVLGSFQDQIEKAAVLATFLPLVISCGGNSGSQAATLVTRALALGEIGRGDWWRIVRREVLTATMLAGALAAMGLTCVFLFNTLIFPLLGKEATLFPVPLALTVSMAIGGVVVWGCLLGSLLPLLLKRFGFDPASASSPMVATLMDASGTLIYFALALAVLTGTIL